MSSPPDSDDEVSETSVQVPPGFASKLVDLHMTSALPVPSTIIGPLLSERISASLAQMRGSWSRELSASLSLGISRSLDLGRLVSPGMLSRLQEVMPELG